MCLLSVETALSRLANVAIPAYVRFKYGGLTFSLRIAYKGELE